MEQSYSRDTTDNDITFLLLNFARTFVKQLSYPNYPKEWSRAPLSKLIPIILKFLDLHPDAIGTTIGKKIKQGQLTTPVGLTYEHLFQPLKDYYLDQYELRSFQTRSLPYEQVNQPHTLANAAMMVLSNELLPAIINTFKELRVDQENENRSLERVADALYEPTGYLCRNSGSPWAFDVFEYLDSWRDMPDNERGDFAKELLSRRG